TPPAASCSRSRRRSASRRAATRRSCISTPRSSRPGPAPSSIWRAWRKAGTAASTSWTPTSPPDAGESALEAGRERSAHGLSHGLLHDQEDLVALVVVVGQDNDGDPLVRLPAD